MTTIPNISRSLKQSFALAMKVSRTWSKEGSESLNKHVKDKFYKWDDPEAAQRIWRSLKSEYTSLQNISICLFFLNKSTVNILAYTIWAFLFLVITKEHFWHLINWVLLLQTS